LRIVYTERRNTKRKKMSQIKIHWDLYLGKLSQREERLRKNCFCVFMRTDLPPEKKDLEKNGKCPKIHLNLPQGELSQREERLRKKLFCVFTRTDLSLG
jgi:hypothetical protein